MIALLVLVFNFGSTEAIARTLVDRQCERAMIEFVRTNDAEDVEWILPARPTGSEIEFVRAVPGEVRAIEALLRSIFPNLAAGTTDPWRRYFGHLWRRLPEVTYVPPQFSNPPAPGEIVAEWEKFRDHFLSLAAIPKYRNVSRSDATPDRIRIKFRPAFRARIAALDPKLRRRLEETRFDARDILETLAACGEQKEGWRNPGSAGRAFKKLWLRVVQVAEPSEFEIVGIEDARKILDGRATEGSAARIVEQFRLFKMVYNRNRPPGPLVIE